MMKNTVVALLALALLGGAALLALGFGLATPGDGVHLIINEHELNLSELGGWQAAAAALGLLIGVAVVLPLTLLLGLLLPLLLLLGALLLVCAAILGAGVLACAPVLLPLLVLVWLWRRSRRRPPAGGSTIAS